MSIHSDACDAPLFSDSNSENIPSEPSWSFNTHDAAAFALDNCLTNPTGFDIPHVTPNYFSLDANVTPLAPFLPPHAITQADSVTIPMAAPPGPFFTLPVMGDMSVATSEQALFNDWVNPQYLVSQCIYPS